MEDILTQMTPYLQFATTVLVLTTTIVGIVVAMLARAGILNKKHVEEARREERNAKEIANAMANAIEELKKTDPAAAKTTTGGVVAKLGPAGKVKLDIFLHERNLNKPT